MGSKGKIYVTGATVPETGIYRIIHTAHRLPHEAVIFKGQRFPKCKGCGEAVLFELAHAAPDLFRYAAYVLYELPEIEDETDSATAG